MLKIVLIQDIKLGETVFPKGTIGKIVLWTTGSVHKVIQLNNDPIFTVCLHAHEYRVMTLCEHLREWTKVIWR